MNHLKLIILLPILMILPLQKALGAGGSDIGGSPNIPVDPADITFYYQDLLLLAQKIKIYARQYHLLSQARISIKEIFRQTYQLFQLTPQAISYAATIKSTLELEVLDRQEVNQDMSAYISENIKEHGYTIQANSQRLTPMEKAIEDNILDAMSRGLNLIKDSIEESNYPIITRRFKQNILDVNHNSPQTSDTQLVKLFLEIFPSVLRSNLEEGLQEILNEDDDEVHREYDNLFNDRTFNTYDGWEKALFAFLSPQEKTQNIIMINTKANEGTLISDVFYMMSPEFELGLHHK